MNKVKIQELLHNRKFVFIAGAALIVLLFFCIFIFVPTGTSKTASNPSQQTNSSTVFENTTQNNELPRDAKVNASATISQEDTTSWKIEDDDIFVFSVPSDWEVMRIPNSNGQNTKTTTVTPPKSNAATKSPSLSIIIADPEHSDFIKQLQSQDEQNHAKKTTMSIGFVNTPNGKYSQKISAKKYETQTKDGIAQTHIYFTALSRSYNMDIVYMISYSAPQSLVAQYDPLFTKIVGSVLLDND